MGFNSYIIFWAWLQDSLTWTCRVKKCRSSSGNLILGFAYETKIPQFIITSLQYNSGKNLFLALQLLYGPFKRPKNLNFYIQLVSMFFCTFCIWYATVCWFFHENWISEEHKFPASSFSTNKQCLQCFEFLNVLKWESKVCKSYPGFGRVSVTPDTWYDNKHVVKKKVQIHSYPKWQKSIPLSILPFASHHQNHGYKLSVRIGWFVFVKHNVTCL